MFGPTEEEVRHGCIFAVVVLIGLLVAAFLAGRYLPLPTIDLNW